MRMKKIISLFLIAFLISGCNRTSGNVSSAPQSSNASALVPQSSNAPALAPKSQNAPASELQPMPSPTLTPSSSVMSVFSSGFSLLWSLFCSVCKIGGYIVICFVVDWLLGYFVVNFIDTYNPEFAPTPVENVPLLNPVENVPLPNPVEEESYSEKTPEFSSFSSYSNEVIEVIEN